nr:MAG TPA: hypothetical protein [Caudoviricetes sp.]
MSNTDIQMEQQKIFVFVRMGGLLFLLFHAKCQPLLYL